MARNCESVTCDDETYTTEKEDSRHLTYQDETMLLVCLLMVYP